MGVSPFRLAWLSLDVPYQFKVRGPYPNNPKMILNEGTTGYKFVGSYSIMREALKETEG